MHKSLLLIASLLLLSQAPAQVRISPEPFPLPPTSQPLPVRPYTPANAASAVPDLVAAPPLAAASAAPPTQLVIRQGHSVDEELRAYARPAGWDLVWDAGPYVAERELVVAGGFEAAIASLLKGVNESGIRMRAVFYRGNHTVRVWEE